MHIVQTIPHSPSLPTTFLLAINQIPILKKRKKWQDPTYQPSLNLLIQLPKPAPPFPARQSTLRSLPINQPPHFSTSAVENDRKHDDLAKWDPWV